MFQKMSCLRENGVCNLFFTLPIKNVNVITVGEKLHELLHECQGYKLRSYIFG